MATTYIKEFKYDAIQYFESHPEMDNREKAEYLGVLYHTLYSWVKEYRRKLRSGDAEPIKDNLTDEEKEIARLKLENRELQDALELLKKSSAFWELTEAKYTAIHESAYKC